VCLTARDLDTILCLLATLPVGFSRPFRKALKEQSFSDEPSCPLCGGMGGGHLRVCWVFSASLLTPFRSATIILMSGRTPNKKELALHIHYFLAAFAKSYNDTT